MLRHFKHEYAIFSTRSDFWLRWANFEFPSESCLAHQIDDLVLLGKRAVPINRARRRTIIGVFVGHSARCISILDESQEQRCTLSSTMSNLPTRNQRLTELKALLNEGSQLIQAASLRGGLGKNLSQIQTDADAWRARALAALSALGATHKWCTWPEQQEFSALSIDQALNGLQIFCWRIIDGRPEVLSDEDIEKINISTRLLTYGSYLIDYATERRDSVLMNILRAFTPFQDTLLPIALEETERWAQQDVNNKDKWMRSLEFIRANFDTGSNIFALDKSVQWHFGWAMFTLGWNLTESLGDSISIGNIRCCTFDQAKVSRIEYIQRSHISCPLCETEADFQLIPKENRGQTGPSSCFWNCEACTLAGYFPRNARPDSVWHVPREQRWNVLRSNSAPQVSAPGSDSTLSVAPIVAADRPALILVAVVTERKALLVEAKEQHIALAEDEIAGRYVDRFSLPRRGGSSWQVVVGQSTEKGPQAAQAAIQDFVRALNPELVLLVGMCGGLPEHNASEQSVIVARQVSNYEPARVRDGHATWSPTAYRSSARITDLANAIAARDILPNIHIMTNKDYGSGEKLVDDLSSDVRLGLLAHSGDLVGFEMEGQGMLHALWELQRSNAAVQACVLKGVSDFGDGQMRANKEERQIAATRRAVQLALEILRRY